ncbi:IniB N-terminal domain-containing protein [Pseudonocardia humida]|uniref:IniB N-terminal domain-containing protein n=1 Tax=Pseudonocardia humida TaxID=2800819 RepID=A0ABT1ADM4_9PSEU|nr:IniB N-terminal domain-containing protein [Pseudonocardia humida]MCO1661172.1 IniB N-terminal domain-containing protein [Pseudonocardia humida]
MDAVLALSDLIEFLVELMRDPATAAEFENDPDAVLAERGLEGVTAQDVRDARLELCDAGGASATGEAAPPSGDDPVREINHTASNYSAAPQVQAAAQEHSALALQAAAPVTIDDRDTFIFQNDFSDDDTTIVNDSFNSDDDVDNSVDAVVDNSVVNNDVTAINDSFNAVDNSVDNSVVENDVVAINAENSFNDGTGIGDVDPTGAGAPLPVEPDGGTGAAPGTDEGGGTDGTEEADGTDAATSQINDEAADAAASEVGSDPAEEEPADEAGEAFDPVA